MRTLLSFVFLFSVVSLILAGDPPKDPKATNVHHVHLSFSTIPGAMSCAWVSYGPAKSEQYVQYGRYKGELKYTAHPVIAESKEDEKHKDGGVWVYKAQLGGLIPHASIYYRIVSVDDKKVFTYSPIYQFKSKPEGNLVQRVQFAAFGDQGVNHKGQVLHSAQQTADRLTNLVNSKPSQLDFVVHLGDLAYAFEDWWKWNQWFDMMQPITSKTPYMIVTGNRDREEVVRDRLTMPVPFNMLNKAPHCLEKQNTYYDFDYGIVGIVTLPNRSAKDYDANDCPQLWEWFEQTLERYHYRVQDPHDQMNWLVAAIHTPFYSSSDGHPEFGGGNKPLKDKIEHLFAKYKVDIGIFGDDHGYERTHPVFDDVTDTHFVQEKNNDGVSTAVYHNPTKTMHFVIGTGGIPLDGWQKPEPPRWSAYREINYGFVKFDVTPTSLSGKFMRSNSSAEVDHFQIVKDNIHRENPQWANTTTTLRVSQSIMFWFIAVLAGTVIFCLKKRGSNFMPFEFKGR